MKLKYIAVGVAALVLVGQCSSDGDTPEPPERTAGAKPRVTTTAVAKPSPTRSATRPAGTDSTPSDSPSADPSPESGSGTALAALAALAVKGRAPMTGYDRNRFGSAWLDADRNGCDTRNDVLATYLVDAVVESNGCVVASGTYADPYTGRTIVYRQGDGTLIDIDHVVAMGNAWVTGAFAWDIKERAAFANDPLNLLPADAGANRQKGDGDSATWLPPNKAFRCAYVSRQVAVKQKYGLWATAPERAAIERGLRACPGQELVADTWQAPTVVDHDIVDPGPPTPAPSPTPAPTTPTPTKSPTRSATPVPLMNVHFENCDAARAAGASPVRRGDPGYGAHLDRDGDGVGCE